MAEAVGVHAPAQPNRSEQVGAAVFDDTCSNPPKDVLLAPYLDDHAIDTGPLK